MSIHKHAWALVLGRWVLWIGCLAFWIGLSCHVVPPNGYGIAHHFGTALPAGQHRFLWRFVSVGGCGTCESSCKIAELVMRLLEWKIFTSEEKRLPFNTCPRFPNVPRKDPCDQQALQTWRYCTACSTHSCQFQSPPFSYWVVAWSSSLCCGTHLWKVHSVGYSVNRNSIEVWTFMVIDDQTKLVDSCSPGDALKPRPRVSTAWSDTRPTM